MEIDIFTHGSVDRVKLPGHMATVNADSARSAVCELADSARIQLVLDLSAVEFLDSSGLSVLVYALKATQKRGGIAVLLSPNDHVRSLIELTRLHQIFEIYDDLATAIARFDAAHGSVHGH